MKISNYKHDLLAGGMIPESKKCNGQKRIKASRNKRILRIARLYTMANPVPPVDRKAWGMTNY